MAKATKLSCCKIVVAESAFRRWYAGEQQPYSQLDSTACGQAKPQESRQHLTKRPLDGFETETSSEDKLDLNLLWRLSAAAKNDWRSFSALLNFLETCCLLHPGNVLDLGTHVGQRNHKHKN